MKAGFKKFMISSKFQIAAVTIGLVYLSVNLLGSTPDTAISCIRDIAVAYFAARVLEPAVEFMVTRIKK